MGGDASERAESSADAFASTREGRGAIADAGAASASIASGCDASSDDAGASAFAAADPGSGCNAIEGTETGAPAFAAADAASGRNAIEDTESRMPRERAPAKATPNGVLRMLRAPDRREADHVPEAAAGSARGSAETETAVEEGCVKGDDGVVGKVSRHAAAARDEAMASVVEDVERARRPRSRWTRLRSCFHRRNACCASSQLWPLQAAHWQKVQTRRCGSRGAGCAAMPAACWLGPSGVLAWDDSVHATPKPPAVPPPR